MNKKQIVSGPKKNFDQIGIPGLSMRQVEEPARRALVNRTLLSFAS